jgi:hypothetical protein
VVRDIAASRSFYEAVFAVLKIPLGAAQKITSGDELFVSTPTAKQRKAT